MTGDELGVWSLAGALAALATAATVAAVGVGLAVWRWVRRGVTEVGERQ